MCLVSILGMSPPDKAPCANILEHLGNIQPHGLLDGFKGLQHGAGGVAGHDSEAFSGGLVDYHDGIWPILISWCQMGGSPFSIRLLFRERFVFGRSLLHFHQFSQNYNGKNDNAQQDEHCRPSFTFCLSALLSLQRRGYPWCNRSCVHAHHNDSYNP